MSSDKNLGHDNLIAFSMSNRDVGFALGVLLMLAMLFIPLPAVVLDLGLAISLSFAALILMVALWIPKPIEFSSFPTLLLIITMLRLSLNVASTRLILSEGHTGTSAAGGVIEGFSRFIVAGSFVIGIIIFAILVIINFIVITKGSTRIAEVSARFSLDAMPGKQMAIDADLGSGMIDEEEAGKRRKALEDESQFYGAMDGASKFVRGDAIAGIIITLINVVGGILIGTVQHNLSLTEAANVYTVLTIGDGLVSQIPALIVSLAAGLIVTKGGTVGAVNEAVLDQLSKFPKALYMAAGLLFGIGLLPGFPSTLFIILSASMTGLGFYIQRNTKALEKEQTLTETDADTTNIQESDDIQEIIKLEDLWLEVGIDIVPLINSPEAALPGKIKSLRKLFAKEFGFILPSVRIKDEPLLPNNTYAILAQGVEVARGEVYPTQMMVINPAESSISLQGIHTKEPAFGLDAVWVTIENANEAENQGYTVVDPESVITTHLTSVIKEHMPELLTYGTTRTMIDNLDREYQKLVAELSVSSPAILVQHVLQALLTERVSIRNLPLIIEAITEASRTSTKVQTITEYVRLKLSNQICKSLTDDTGFISVITMSPAWEKEFKEAVRTNGDDKNFIMSPQRVQDFVLAARKNIQQYAEKDEWPALMVAPEVRSFVRSMLERASPLTQIISHNEIHRKATLRTVATIGG